MARRYSILSVMASLIVWSGLGVSPLFMQATHVPNSAWSSEPGTTGSSLTQPALQTSFDRVSRQLVRNDLRMQSAASCAATACHGGPGAGISNPSALRGSEYPLWLERDPHSLSWRTICGESSIEIMERLRIMQSGKIIDQAGFDNCLACHNSTRQFTEFGNADHFREGVGCGGCHGPSEKWRSTHFQTAWEPSHAIEDGFVPSKNLLARARMCASCHVGDRDRDMNHDIIAAGHPALHYEFATFHQRQPKHWRDKREADAIHYEASLWLAGQLAALDASLVLLEARASQALPGSQWPELSSFNCSDCHQPLRLGDFDPAHAIPFQAKPEYSNWNRFGVQELLRLRLAEGEGSPQDLRLDEALKILSLTMRSSDSTASLSKQAAEATRMALNDWLNSPEGFAEIQQFSAQRLRDLAISAGSQHSSLRSWETVTQFYLASIAARESWPKLPTNSGQTASPQTASPQGSRSSTGHLLSARQLRDTLTFPNGTNSPQRAFEFTSSAARLNHLRALETAMHDNAGALPIPRALDQPRPDINHNPEKVAPEPEGNQRLIDPGP